MAAGSSVGPSRLRKVVFSEVRHVDRAVDAQEQLCTNKDRRATHRTRSKQKESKQISYK